MNFGILSATCLVALAQAVLVAGSEATTGVSANLTVDLGYEIYQGYYNASTSQNVWQGIRYAAPALGQNRFKAPQPPTVNRRQVISATTLPPRCPQGPQAPMPARYNYTGSEDCLFLSVYSPANASNLPVFVWM